MVANDILYPANSHFGTFQWLGDTDDHGQLQAAYDFTFSSNHGSISLFLRYL